MTDKLVYVRVAFKAIQGIPNSTYHEVSKRNSEQPIKHNRNIKKTNKTKQKVVEGR